MGVTTPSPNPVFDYIFQSDNRWSMSTLKMDHVLNVVLGGIASDPYCQHKDHSPCKPGERNSSIDTSSILQLVTHVDVAERYLDGLSASAYKNNVSIMLCMSFPNVLMHSVNNLAMTHGRGSRIATYDTMHTISHLTTGRAFGGESTFIWSLGLWPFKDTFYSNSSSRKKRFCGRFWRV